MAKRILITGGAGFIGSHLADALLQHGYTVRALDSLAPEVHGDDACRPDYLDPAVELQVGDVRDPVAVRRALEGVDAVFHFAAKVGVGQSMYQVADYAAVNNEGTAVLLEALMTRPVERLIVASCTSIYGEGMYRTPTGALVAGTERSLAQLQAHDWDLRSSRGEPLTPVPTPETKSPALASVYALGKYDQERMGLLVGRAYRIPTVALRFSSVYGPRQALGHGSSGVLAKFAARYLAAVPPVIFEDGRQRRDFVHVRDIVAGCRLALEVARAADKVFNLGSGENLSVRALADRIANALGQQQREPLVAQRYRMGDVRHCFPDITLARRVLGYAPEVVFEEGLAEFATWLESRAGVVTVRADADAELAVRGLTV